MSIISATRPSSLVPALLLVSFCVIVALLVFASSVRMRGVVVGDVVSGLRKTTVVCVILAVVGSVEEIIVEEAAVEGIEVVVVGTVVVLGVVVARTVVVLGVVVICAVVVLVVTTVVHLVVRLVVARGVVVVALGVVEGGATELVVRALIVTGEGRGIAVVVVRTVVFRVAVFTVVGRLVVRLVTGGKVVVLTVGRLVVEVVVSRLVVEEDVTS
jgi:hypothetical protein